MNEVIAETAEKTDIDRRRFIKGGAFIGGSALVAGVAGRLTAGKEVPAAWALEAEDTDLDIIETREVDIVVVGAGMSGLAAGMEAGDRGLSCVVLEKLTEPGGNGPITSGIFGYKSSYQEQQGIDVDLGFILCEEGKTFAYLNDALAFRDMALASAGDIEWLESHGVGFSGVVDGYLVGSHALSTQHWWANESGSSYVDAAVSELDRMGVELLLETPAVKLVLEDGAVKGVVAKSENGYVEFRAKGTILATGGWLNNVEQMERLGYAQDTLWVDCLDGHDGDGLRLAMEAGAVDLSVSAGYVGNACLSDQGFPAPTDDLVINGKTLWVNQNGERFVDESVGSLIPAYSSNALFSQGGKAFVVFDQTLADQIGQSIIDEVMGANSKQDKWIEDTVDALAEDMGVDPERLKATVTRYNELAAAGVDTDFCKAADCMTAVAEAPFYAARLNYDYLCSVGGIHTDRNMRVIDLLRRPIEGLYAIGVDGCELYKDTYTINIPASCNGNNVYSGRQAVRSICGEGIDIA